jgi:hypothetical protein
MSSVKHGSSFRHLGGILRAERLTDVLSNPGLSTVEAALKVQPTLVSFSSSPRRPAFFKPRFAVRVSARFLSERICSSFRGPERAIFDCVEAGNSHCVACERNVTTYRVSQQGKNAGSQHETPITPFPKGG